jgi:hypothetical protein
MGVYTPASFADNEIPTPTKLNAEFTKIATAVNAITSAANIAADGIAVAALANDAYDYAISMEHEGEAAATHLITEVVKSAPIMRAADKIVAVSVVATAVTGSPTVDVYSVTTGATVLSAPMTLVTANVAVAGTVALTTARSLNEVLTMRIVADVSNKATDIRVTILLKNQLVSAY